MFGDDRRLADILIRGLKADPALTVGINEPYSPADQVYYTVERHAHPSGLPAAMIEIRNDEIGDRAGQQKMGGPARRYSLCSEADLASASRIVCGVNLAVGYGVGGRRRGSNGRQ